MIFAIFMNSRKKMLALFLEMIRMIEEKIYHRSSDPIFLLGKMGDTAIQGRTTR